MSASFVNESNTDEHKVSRSALDIQAEIESLQQELAKALIVEKRSTYEGKFPTTLYTWDIYIDETEKGTWCGADKEGIDWDGIVYETEEEAIEGGQNLLKELEDEGELEYDSYEYIVDTIAIPFKELTAETLEYSNLDYLIPPIE